MSGIAELQEDCRTTSMDEDGLVDTEQSSKETSLTHNSRQLGATLRFEGMLKCFGSAVCKGMAQ
eukprot:6351458-Karenia_brevis.AAC.1